MCILFSAFSLNNVQVNLMEPITSNREAISRCIETQNAELSKS